VDKSKLVIGDGPDDTNLDEEIRLLELELKEQEQEIDALELQELQVITQKNMLKSMLIEPLRDFHNKVKEETEDNSLNIRQVAPGPDT